MKKLLAVLLLTLSLPICQSAKEDRAIIILPNLKLLRCKSAECYQLWSEQLAHANAVFPKQLIFDSDQGCPYGITAICEKSVVLDDLNAAIDDQYGKWKVSGFEKPQHRLWRVEPEKFAIQLAVLDKKAETRGLGEAGTSQVILLAFGGRSACAH